MLNFIIAQVEPSSSQISQINEYEKYLNIAKAIIESQQRAELEKLRYQNHRNIKSVSLNRENKTITVIFTDHTVSTGLLTDLSPENIFITFMELITTYSLGIEAIAEKDLYNLVLSLFEVNDEPNRDLILAPKLPNVEPAISKKKPLKKPVKKPTKSTKPKKKAEPEKDMDALSKEIDDDDFAI